MTGGFSLLLALLLVSSCLFANACSDACQTANADRLTNADATHSQGGYQTGTCGDLAGERAGTRNKCAADYFGVPDGGPGFPGSPACGDSCTTDACNAACGTAFQDCCYGLEKANSQIYLTECLAACPPETGCAGATCPTSCNGNTIKEGECDPQSGECNYHEGYCEFGCNYEHTACSPQAPASNTYTKGDEICEFVKGESCSISPDCVCLAGTHCEPSADGANDAGCAPDKPFACGDGTCDYAKGETCASCPPSQNDCACDAGRTCDPSHAGADRSGCYSPTAKSCVNIKCPDKCDESQSSADANQNGEKRLYNGRCVEGACQYDSMFCTGNNLCDNGQCVPIDVALGKPKVTAKQTQEGGCVQDGVYLIPSGSKVRLVNPVYDENGQVLEFKSTYISNGQKHCKGEMVATEPGSKAVIKFSNGVATYLGSNTMMTKSEIFGGAFIIKGTARIRNPGAITEGEQGITTMVPYSVAKEIQDTSDTYVPNMQDKRLALFYLENAMMNRELVLEGGLKWLTAKQHSDVIYEVSDDRISVTVLNGSVEFSDKDGGAALVTTGQQMTATLAATPLQSASVSEASASAIASYKSQFPDADMAASPPIQPGVCPGVLLALFAFGCVFIVSHRPSG